MTATASRSQQPHSPWTFSRSARGRSSPRVELHLLALPPPCRGRVRRSTAAACGAGLLCGRRECSPIVHSPDEVAQYKLNEQTREYRGNGQDKILSTSWRAAWTPPPITRALSSRVSTHTHRALCGRGKGPSVHLGLRFALGSPQNVPIASGQTTLKATSVEVLLARLHCIHSYFAPPLSRRLAASILCNGPLAGLADSPPFDTRRSGPTLLQSPVFGLDLARLVMPSRALAPHAFSAV